jgi:hypothetical protein
MVSAIPKQKLMSWIEKEKRAVSAALQPRYSGPYPIIKVVSPVIYIVRINGIDKVVHAINMKLFKGTQTYTTPYVQHGFERSEAAKNMSKEPLLMSPDPQLNETARTLYRKINSGLQRDYTRKSKLKAYKKEVDKEMSEKQSLSPPQALQEQLLEEYANIEDDDEIKLHNEWFIERERLRIILLDEARSEFAKKSVEEQEYEITQLSKTGYSMEDLVDQVLDKQEHKWFQAAKNDDTLSDTQSPSDDLSPEVSDNEEVEVLNIPTKTNTTLRR